MLQEVRDGEDHLEQHHSLGGSANQRHCGETNGKGEEEFTRMEADPRGRREGRVRVMDLVEAPQEGNAMVGPMPAVGNEVQSDESGGNGEPPWYRQGVQHAESRSRRPACDRAGASA